MPILGSGVDIMVTSGDVGHGSFLTWNTTSQLRSFMQDYTSNR